MKPEQILEALSKLDPSDDSHWTQDGSPRLGAVGEGVARPDILAVAPLFNRKNPVLPEADAEPTEEEILEEVKRQADEFQARKEAADKEYKEALKAKEDAEVRLNNARLELTKIAHEEKARDTRTDTQINMDYLKSEHEQRLKRVLQQNEVYEHLKKFNLPTDNLNMSTVSLVDRAIAERNIRARRERLRKGGRR